MNEQRTIMPEPNLIARGTGAIGRLPVYGHIQAVGAGAFVRPFLFFMSAVAVAAGIYFFALAVPIYTSDVQIAVRGKQALTTSPLMAALGAVQSGVPESTALTSYIESDGMLVKLDQSQQLRQQYGRFRTDIFYHLPASASHHGFLTFYDGMVDVSLDPVANIITLHVRGFDPENAHKTALAIMKLSGDFVQTLSAQMMDESTRAAQQDFDLARADSIKSHSATAAFQGRSQTLDPSAYGSATSSAIFSLQSAITQLRTQLASLMTYSTAKAPQVVQVQAQIRQLQGQEAQLQQKLTGQQTNGTVLSQLGTFEGLTIQQTYADQRLTAAQSALDQAKSVAQQRQLFIVPITGPTLPDEPTPRRWWGFFTVLAIGACLYTIGRLTLASIRDHQI